MHSSCFTGDLVASLRCDCGDQLHMALSMIAAEGAGALVYLPQEGRGIGLVPKLKAYVLQDEGMDTVEANHKLGFKADMRDYMVGLQVLKDLGLSKVRLLTNNPKKTDAFVYGGVDLQVVEQIPIVAAPEKQRVQYLATKRDKLGHLLPADRTDPGDSTNPASNGADERE
jgi:3,4-dihydroxy 2-butanone 4-phosphate synthase/GTP cyclohydrolase II